MRKDGATFPVEISLSAVPAATGQFTLAVIRDTTTARQRDDLIHLAQAAAAEQAHNGLKLLDSVLSNLLKAGLSLQAAIDLLRWRCLTAHHRSSLPPRSSTPTVPN